MGRTLQRRALGMVETIGFSAATEAADAMLKSARVELLPREVTHDAWVTVLVRGDQAEVEAAVAAGAAAAARIGQVQRAHVIPAPDPSLTALLDARRGAAG